MIMASRRFFGYRRLIPPACKSRWVSWTVSRMPNAICSSLLRVGFLRPAKMYQAYVSSRSDARATSLYFMFRSCKSWFRYSVRVGASNVQRSTKAFGSDELISSERRCSVSGSFTGRALCWKADESCSRLRTWDPIKAQRRTKVRRSNARSRRGRRTPPRCIVLFNAELFRDENVFILVKADQR